VPGKSLHADNNEQKGELQFKEREQLGSISQRSLGGGDESLSMELTKAARIQA